jgi:hypothetical protein
MTDSNQALLDLLKPGALKAALFPPTSRYYGIDTATLEGRDGSITIFLRRRFVPPPERFALLLEHLVIQGERLDNITARYLGDPEQFWRVCDANRAMNPDELTERDGRRLRITLPEGIPGATAG